jgi:7-cyano-7-deazaguanine synthase
VSESRPAVVLLSGGLDSATTAALAKADGFRVHALTVRYGQRHDLEVQRAAKLARQLGLAEHRVVEVDLGAFGGSALTDRSIELPRARREEQIGSGIPSSYVPARNTVFLAIALAWAETLNAVDIFIGANVVDYSGYPDCRPEFLRSFEKTATLATRIGVEGQSIRIRAPLIDSSKAEIVKMALEQGIDLGLTLSCYAPSAQGRPCGDCDACVLRARGFLEAGITDPAA